MLLRVRNGNHLRRLFPIGCHDGFEQILRGGRRVGNRVGSGKNRFADGFVRLAAGGDQGHPVSYTHLTMPTILRV